MTAAGGRCRAFAHAGSPLCIFHDPAYREAHRQNAAQGGRRTGRLVEEKRRAIRPVDLSTGEARAKMFGYVISAALSGHLSDRQLATINRAMSLAVRDAAAEAPTPDITALALALAQQPHRDTTRQYT